MSESANAPLPRPTSSIREAEAIQSLARQFFDREPPEGYIREWTQRLAHPEAAVEPDLVSLILFRIGPEWLALPTELLVEVTHAQPVHAVPFRTDRTLRGLVNVRGQLRLCFSLHEIVSVDEQDATESNDHTHHLSSARMVIIQESSVQWVFLADEVARVLRVPQAGLRRAPSTLSAQSSLTRSVFNWNGRTVGLLDTQRLMNVLRSLAS